MTSDQMTAVDNDLAREQHLKMPISKPDRQTSVTFRKEEGQEIQIMPLQTGFWSSSYR